jgi:hypothetical protein
MEGSYSQVFLEVVLPQDGHFWALRESRLEMLPPEEA